MNCFRFALVALSSATLAASSAQALAGCAQTAKMAYSEGVRTQKFMNIGQKTKKDPLDLYICAAEKETDPKLKGKYYNVLADTLEKRGDTSGAYDAYEQAALAGNESAGKKIFKSQESGAYKPHALSQIASIIYVPKAQGENGAHVALLLAKLVDSGELKGPEFKTSAFWLQRAVDGGSTSAIRKMAEQTSEQGDIEKAASYFRLVDKKPPSVRALREARGYFLGKGKPTNTKLGLAWLSYGSKLAPADSAKLAARFYRVTNGVVYTAELKKIAAAGGIHDLRIGTGGNKILLAAYVAAKTDKEKLRVLADLITKSKSGDGTADYALARILESDGGFATYKPADYYISALKKGNVSALPNVTSFVAVLDPADPLVERILSVLTRVAQAGNLDAQKTLGSLYIVGGPVAVDYAKGTEWLKKASDAGDADAKYRLGVLLVQNNRDGADLATGRNYLQSAAASGNEAAKKFFVELSKTNP
jgi:TPR repeat protein